MEKRERTVDVVMKGEREEERKEGLEKRERRLCES